MATTLVGVFVVGWLLGKMYHMADSYECIECHKQKAGRFTRPKDSALGQLRGKPGRKIAIPYWYCWTCLPKGQGRDEEVNHMAKTEALAPVKAAAAFDLNKTRTEGLSLSAPLITRANTLKVIDPESYLEADTVLHQIRQGRKSWGKLWTVVQERVVRPLRDSLEGAYSINRDVDGPLEAAENAVKAKMTAYKMEEQRRLLDEQRKRDEEAARLEEEIRKKQEAAQKASTPQMRGKLERQVEQLTEQQVDVVTTVAVPTTGAFSSERKVPTPVISNPLLFWENVADGSIELDAKMQEELRLWLGREYRKDKDAVTAWPGITIEMKPQIVGR